MLCFSHVELLESKKQSVSDTTEEAGCVSAQVFGDPTVILEPFFLAIRADPKRYRKIILAGLDGIRTLMSQRALERRDDRTVPTAVIVSIVDHLRLCETSPADDVLEKVVQVAVALSMNVSCMQGVRGDALLNIIRACYYCNMRRSAKKKQGKERTVLPSLKAILRRCLSEEFVGPWRLLYTNEDGTTEVKGDDSEAHNEEGDIVHDFVTDEVTEKGSSEQIIDGDDGTQRDADSNGGEGAVSDGGDDNSAGDDKGDGASDAEGASSSVVEVQKDEKDDVAVAVAPPKDGDPERGRAQDGVATVQLVRSKLADSLNVIKLLCDFALEDLDGDEHAVHSRQLTLILLRDMIVEGDRILLQKPLLTAAPHLVAVVVNNALETFPGIVKCACSLFVILFRDCRLPLRDAFSYFMDEIVIGQLISPLTPPRIKATFVEMLHEVCSSPQFLVDIFVNCDCDTSQPNVFSEMLQALSRVSAVGAERELICARTVALQALSASTECLVQWIKEPLEYARQSGKPVESKCLDKMLVLLPFADHVAFHPSPTYLQYAEGTLDAADGPGPDELLSLMEHPFDPHGSLCLPGLAEENLLFKTKVEECVQIFNLNPSKGYKALVSTGTLEEGDVRGLARIFYLCPLVNKKGLGEFFGDPDTFNQDVLREYITLMDFANVEVDEALRVFVQSFWLPGEAQKIDRIVEVFSEKYFEENPTSFRSADTVYVLAFSLVMLNTDQHNSEVRRKMTFEDFKANNSGIDVYAGDDEQDIAGVDVEEVRLRGMFDRMANKEMRMKEDEVHSFAGLPQALREKAIADERKVIRLRCRAIVEDLVQRTMQRPLLFGRHVAIAKLMFESVWPPIVACVSSTMHGLQDECDIDACLSCVRASMCVAATFGMRTERGTLVKSLSSFTRLSGIGEIAPKNISCINLLIDLAVNDGNLLGDTWHEVITCVSLLESLQLFGEGDSVLPDVPDAIDGGGGKSRPGNVSMALSGGKGASVGGGTSGAALHASSIGLATMRNVVLQMSSATKSIGSDGVDRVFEATTALSSCALDAFCEALCECSMSELSLKPPRLFSMQKLMLVATRNMSRAPTDWGVLWQRFSAHLILVATVDDTKIAWNAVDLLRSMHKWFIDVHVKNIMMSREVFEAYTSLLIRPFGQIVQSSQAVTVRSLCIACINQIVMSSNGRLDGGWRSVFHALRLAAADDCAELVQSAFELLKVIFGTYFDVVASAFFPDLLNCIISFAQNEVVQLIAVDSIGMLEMCASDVLCGRVRIELVCQANRAFGHEGVVTSKEATEVFIRRLSVSVRGNHDGTTRSELATDSEVHASEAEDVSGDLSFTDSDEDVQVWLPILTGFYANISHSSETVREAVIESLFSVLSRCVPVFSSSLWAVVYRWIINPLFSELRSTRLDVDAHWINTSGCKLMESFVLFFMDNHQVLSFLWPAVLDVLELCVLRRSKDEDVVIIPKDVATSSSVSSEELSASSPSLLKVDGDATPGPAGVVRVSDIDRDPVTVRDRLPLHAVKRLVVCVMFVGHRLSVRHWDMFASTCERLAQASLPLELLAYESKKERHSRAQKNVHASDARASEGDIEPVVVASEEDGDDANDVEKAGVSVPVEDSSVVSGRVETEEIEHRTGNTCIVALGEDDDDATGASTVVDTVDDPCSLSSGITTELHMRMASLRCVVHLRILDLVHVVLRKFLTFMPFSIVERFLLLLRRSYGVAVSFNVNYNHRYLFVEDRLAKTSPLLLMQETLASRSIFLTLYATWCENGNEADFASCDDDANDGGSQNGDAVEPPSRGGATIDDATRQIVVDSLFDFLHVQANRLIAIPAGHISALDKCGTELMDALNEFATQLDDKRFGEHVRQLYALALKLVSTEDPRVRLVTQLLFGRLGRVLLNGTTPKYDAVPVDNGSIFAEAAMFGSTLHSTSSGDDVQGGANCGTSEQSSGHAIQEGETDKNASDTTSNDSEGGKEDVLDEALCRVAMLSVSRKVAST